MSLEEEIDFTGYDADKVERGDSLAAGWYKVQVCDVYSDRKNQDAIVFEMQVIEGPDTGTKLFDRLNNPDSAETDNGRRFAAQRKRLFAKRLGLVAEFGAPRPVNWLDAIGREIFVQVKERTYKDRNGEEKTVTGVDYAGVYPLDHDKVPEEVRNNYQTPDGMSGPAASTPPKPRPAGSNGAANSKPAATKPARQKGLDDISV